ncbi:unnamed protein product [Lactuca virosa]|uniref:Uncharacterized protein n=1 Tax=Lactuca virosa TaxID=75947 RepID=A0AAU9NBH2_9ASTR|nr:unnamed protein product [Lactuca virosa]
MLDRKSEQIEGVSFPVAPILAVKPCRRSCGFKRCTDGSRNNRGVFGYLIDEKDQKDRFLQSLKFNEDKIPKTRYSLFPFATLSHPHSRSFDSLSNRSLFDRASLRVCLNLLLLLRITRSINIGKSLRVKKDIAVVRTLFGS